jgi:hypothetical protein
MTQELANLEDLPADYREALTRQNLVPLAQPTRRACRRVSRSPAPAFVFIADETPLHRKLGVLGVRD